MMKPLQQPLRSFNKVHYARIPFYIAEEYGLEQGGIVEYDRSDPKILILKIKPGDRND